MSVELVTRIATATPVVAPKSIPDTAFAARSRFVQLREALASAAKQLRGSRWNEPAVFFFDRKRQAELEAERPATPDRFADLSARIAAEMPTLLAAVEVRRVARAVGLKDAALALAPHCPAAKELADLLAVPDDEVILILAPNQRFGVRLHLRGVADVAQLRQLLVPVLGDRDFQLFTPAAIQPAGTLPAGSEHWLWPTQPLTVVPRINGERVVLVGPTIVTAAREVELRFPSLAVECEVIATLNAFQVADELSRLCGRPVPVQSPVLAPVVARAA